MLNIRVVYCFSEVREEFRPMSVETVIAHVRAMSEMVWPNTPLDVSGDLGIVTVTNDQFVLHAYVIDPAERLKEEIVRFELFCLRDQSDDLKPTTTEVCEGILSVESLRATLVLLDERRSPMEYLRQFVVGED